MSEGDVQNSLPNTLAPISREDAEIDEFEKLYAITSAKLMSSRMFDEEAYDALDFDEICNFAQYKLKNPYFFEGNERQPTQKDTSFYIIPIHIKMAGSKIKCEALIDKEGNGLYIILPNGKVIPSAEFKKLTEIETFLKSNEWNDFEAAELLKEGQGINEISKMIKDDELSIDAVRKKAFEIVRARKKNPEDIIRSAQKRNLDEQEEKSEEQQAEKTLDSEESLEDDRELEEAAREQAERDGVPFDLLKIIAEKKGCKVHQISYRELEDQKLVEEMIGTDLDQYRGSLAVVRITYGFKEEAIVVNKETGQILVDNRANDHELMELVPKWPHVTRMPITRKRDGSNLDMSYIDKFGNVSATRFEYNGKQIDMAKEERERYLAEVFLADKELSDAINEYQKIDPSKQPDLAREKWKVVSMAMAKRISIDNKYDALNNQRKITARTLETTIDQTIKEVGEPGIIKSREEEIKRRLAREEEDPRLRHSWDPRWDF